MQQRRMDAVDFQTTCRVDYLKLDFLELPDIEQRVHIQQAAFQRNVSPVIIEKDFWVCWLLSVLFKSKFADSLVF